MSTVSSSRLRATGLYSGLDTDTLIADQMRIQKQKYTNLQSTKVRNEWKKDAYTEFNNLLRKFRDDFASFTSTSGRNLLSASTFKNNVLDMGATSAFTATASSTAAAGTYTLRVDQIAKGARVEGQKATKSDEGLSSEAVNKKMLGETLNWGSPNTDGTFSFEINGESFTFNTTDTLKHVMDTVNNNKNADVNMTYSQLTDSFTIERKTVDYKPELSTPPQAPSLDDYANELDPDYLEALDDYNKAMEEYEAGRKASLDIEDTSGFLKKIGMNTDDVLAAQKAKYTLNGVDKESDTNRFTMEGLDFNLMAPTVDMEGNAETVKMTIKRDVQKSVDAVKSFVEQYNTLVENFYKALTEKKSKDYGPLTDDQKAEMSDTEVELWEAKAKEGQLRRDPSLTKLMDSMRTALYDVADVGSLESIGLQSSGYKASTPTTITLDETKLTEALTNNPDKVAALFTTSVKNDDGTVNEKESGLMVRLNSAFDTFIASTRDVESKLLDERNTELDERMKVELERLNAKEDFLYSQYAALEKYMSQMQSQTSALSGLATS